jgi:hypothetical protein
MGSLHIRVRVDFTVDDSLCPTKFRESEIRRPLRPTRLV